MTLRVKQDAIDAMNRPPARKKRTAVDAWKATKDKQRANLARETTKPRAKEHTIPQAPPVPDDETESTLIDRVSDAVRQARERWQAIWDDLAG